MKYIIDTDIGDDIDDILAVVYALKKNLDIIGITTVCRNTRCRAEMVKSLLDAYGLNISVYAGYANGEITKYNENEIFCQYSDEMKTADYENKNGSAESAIDFIIASAKQYEKELTILAIGPLTNIAKAIKKDGDAMSKCNIAVMGGDFNGRIAESNIFTDPESAEVVATFENPITFIGCDLTNKTVLNSEQYQTLLDICKENDERILIQSIKKWQDHEKRFPCLHDVLLVYLVINPQKFSYIKSKIAVELTGTFTRGVTCLENEIWHYGNYHIAENQREIIKRDKNRYFIRGAQHVIARETDITEFFNDYFETIQIKLQ